MPRRGDMASDFGSASFDKEFGAANASFSRGLGNPISLVLFKYYQRSITQFGQCVC